MRRRDTGSPSRVVEIMLSQNAVECELLANAVRAAGFHVELVTYDDTTGVALQTVPSRLLVHEADLAAVTEILESPQAPGLLPFESGYPRFLDRSALDELAEIPALTINDGAGRRELVPVGFEWWAPTDSSEVRRARADVLPSAELGPPVALSDPVQLTIHTGVLPSYIHVMGYDDLTDDGGPATADAPLFEIDNALIMREESSAFEVVFGAPTTFTISLDEGASELRLIVVQIEWALEFDILDDVPLVRCTWATHVH